MTCPRSSDWDSDCQCEWLTAFLVQLALGANKDAARWVDFIAPNMLIFHTARPRFDTAILHRNLHLAADMDGRIFLDTNECALTRRVYEALLSINHKVRLHGVP